MRSTTIVASLLLALTFHAGTATADDAGLGGSVVGVDVNTDKADLYLQYFGRLFVKNSDGDLDEYRWGGTSCGSRNLTEEQISMLQRALHNKKMTIQPRSQDGQGNTKCLVGFLLVEKKNLKLFP